MSFDGKTEIPSPQPFDQAEGVTPASSEGRSGFLSDVIIELGLAPREIVDGAVEESRLVGQMPEEILIQSGAITPEQLAIAISERNGLPFVDLFRFQVDKRATLLIDSDTARRYRALPIAVDTDGALVVALADPMDALAVSDIGVITKSEVRTAVASEPGLDSVLQTLPPSKRAARLSAHGPDGLAGARASELGGGAWSLTKSISTPEPTTPQRVAPEPVAEAPAPPVAKPEPAAGASPDLEGRIDALVAAALEKRLQAAATPAPTGDEALTATQQQLAQAREQAAQAQAELAALNARLQELEGGAPPVAPSPVDERLENHLEQVMRELGTTPGSAG